MDIDEVSASPSKTSKLSKDLGSLVGKIKNKEFKKPKKPKSTEVNINEPIEVPRNDKVSDWFNEAANTVQKSRSDVMLSANTRNRDFIFNNEETATELNSHLRHNVRRKNFNRAEIPRVPNERKGLLDDFSANKDFVSLDPRKDDDSYGFYSARKRAIVMSKSDEARSKVKRKDGHEFNDSYHDSNTTFLSSETEKSAKGNKPALSLDEDVTSCLVRLKDLLRRTPEDEKHSVAEDIMFACENHEFTVIANESSCSTITSILPFLSAEQIVAFVSNFSSKKQMKKIIANRSGSEFVESCCLNAVKFMTESEKRMSEINGLYEFAEAVVHAIGSSVSSYQSQFFWAHLIRAVVCLLFESDAYTNQNEKQLKGKQPNKEQEVKCQKNCQVYPDLQKLLITNLADYISSFNLPQIIEKKNFSLVIQTFVRATSDFGMIEIGDKLLKHVFNTEHISEKDLKLKVTNFGQDPYLSPFVEVIIDTKQSTLNKLFLDAINENVSDLCSHPVGNYIVQALIRRKEFQGGLKALTSEITNILSCGNFHLLSKLVQSVNNESPADQLEIFESILTSFECTDKNKCFQLLSYLVTESIYTNEKDRTLHFTSEACSLIKSLFDLKSKQVLKILADSLLASSREFFEAVFSDTYMSHVFRNYATSRLSTKYKSALIKKIDESMPTLIVHKVASRAIEDVFNEVQPSLKEEIVVSVAKVDMHTLEKHHNSFIVLHKIKLKLFNKNPEKWRKVIVSEWWVKNGKVSSAEALHE